MDPGVRRDDGSRVRSERILLPRIESHEPPHPDHAPYLRRFTENGSGIPRTAVRERGNPVTLRLPERARTHWVHAFAGMMHLQEAGNA